MSFNEGDHNTRFDWNLFGDRVDGFDNRMDEATRRIRVEVPNFHGRLDPYAFQDWITSLEDYFDWFNLAAERKVRFVKMKLKGQARVWWHSVEEQLHRLRQPPIADWEDMKLKLQEKYLPIDYEEALFEELLLLRQGNSSVEDYTNKFHELSIRSHVAETERQTIARYKAGLRGDIRKEFLTVRLVSVEEAYQLALRVESQTKGFQSKRSFPTWSNMATRSPTTPAMRSSIERFSSKPGVFQEKNQNPREERKGKVVTGNKTNKGNDECYKCGGKGHYAIVCPTRDQKFTLVCEEDAR